jgi:hypothetical protein
MRASLWVLGIVLAAHVAEASTVVVLSDPQSAPALGSALQVTLAGRGVAIATLPPPDGNLRLDRAASAQHAAVQFNADAALWIDSEPDGTEVCAVSADGRFFRHAPLPVGEGDTARMFAAIATSLLDELLAPPDAPAVDVDVHVHVGPDGAVSATPAVGVAPPGMAAPGIAVVAPRLPEARVRMDRTLFEIGPMASPITFGAELGVATPIGEAYRVGAFGILNLAPGDDNHILGGGGLELRHVGRGMHHFDIGPVVGVAGLVDASNPDAIVFAGARLAFAWEGEHHGSSVSLVPVLMGTSEGLMPGVYASYRWELPL